MLPNFIGGLWFVQESRNISVHFARSYKITIHLARSCNIIFRKILIRSCRIAIRSRVRFWVFDQWAPYCVKIKQLERSNGISQDWESSTWGCYSSRCCFLNLGWSIILFERRFQHALYYILALLKIAYLNLLIFSMHKVYHVYALHDRMRCVSERCVFPKKRLVLPEKNLQTLKGEIEQETHFDTQNHFFPEWCWFKARDLLPKIFHTYFNLSEEILFIGVNAGIFQITQGML